MHHFKNLAIAFIFVGACGLMFPCHALAYLDLGTGSYMLQVALAMLVGVLFAARQWWTRIITYFKSKTSGKAER